MLTPVSHSQHNTMRAKMMKGRISWRRVCSKSVKILFSDECERDCGGEPNDRSEIFCRQHT